MASRSVFYSAPSSFLAKAGPGTVYSVTVGDPAAGGSVVVADLLDWGAAGPNLGIPSSVGPNLIGLVKFPASPQPVNVPIGRAFTNGLSVAVSSTQGVHVYFD